MTNQKIIKESVAPALAFLLVLVVCAVRADDSVSKVREGVKLYAADQFEEASKAFSAASESLEKAKSEKAAIAAFDEACALHRKGDMEMARDRYLKAGLSQDKSIATKAHYNIGLISSEAARKMAGESPENVPPEKRQEILGELSKSIDSYRHCLELDPKHGPARHNLELLRQWIKYYTDRWRAVDLEKRRKETNLIQFLEYLMSMQLAIKESVDGLQPNSSPNLFAEQKRVQDELSEEIPYLKDKIETELRPPEPDPKNPAGASNAQSMTAKDKEELERGIALLQGWADEASSKMESAGKELLRRQPKQASDQQQSASDKLDQIWDAVVPFHPLLAKELAEQTSIAKELTPTETSATDTESPQGGDAEPDNSAKSAAATSQLKVRDNEFAKLLEQQERTLRKTRLLAPKAASELEQVQNQPPPQEPEATTPESETEEGKAAANKVDPEAIKAGYQKAIDLAPKAVEEMESAVKQLRKQERTEAATHAEEARRILKEIQDAQPKNPEQQQQDQKEENKEQNQDQKDNEDQKQDQNKENQKDKKDKQGDEPKQDENKPEDKKENDKKESEKNKDDKDKKSGQTKDPKLSKDRIDEAMRLVREREQEKRERDRELKARIMGRVPVDKDW